MQPKRIEHRRLPLTTGSHSGLVPSLRVYGNIKREIEVGR